MERFGDAAIRRFGDSAIRRFGDSAIAWTESQRVGRTTHCSRPSGPAGVHSPAILPAIFEIDVIFQAVELSAQHDIHCKHQRLSTARTPRMGPAMVATCLVAIRL